MHKLIFILIFVHLFSCSSDKTKVHCEDINPLQNQDWLRIQVNKLKLHSDSLYVFRVHYIGIGAGYSIVYKNKRNPFQEYYYECKGRYICSKYTGGNNCDTTMKIIYLDTLYKFL